jgi:hypothetical protein
MVDVGDSYYIKRHDWREHLAKSSHRSLHRPTIYFPLWTSSSNLIQLYQILRLFSDDWGDKTIKCRGVFQKTSISDNRLEGVRKSEKHLELGAPRVQVRRITASADSVPDVSTWNGYGRISQSSLPHFHHLFFQLCTIVNTLTLIALKFYSANKCINNNQVKLPSILWNPKVHYRDQNSSSRVSILSQMNPVHTLPSHFFHIHFIIISLTPRSH